MHLDDQILRLKLRFIQVPSYEAGLRNGLTFAFALWALTDVEEGLKQLLVSLLLVLTLIIYWVELRRANKALRRLKECLDDTYEDVLHHLDGHGQAGTK